MPTLPVKPCFIQQCLSLLTLTAPLMLGGCNGRMNPLLSHQRSLLTAKYSVTSTLPHDHADVTYINEQQRRIAVHGAALPFSKVLSVPDGQTLVLSCQGSNQRASYRAAILCGANAHALAPISSIDNEGDDPVVCSTHAGDPPLRASDTRAHYY